MHKELPAMILRALEGGEAKVGKILFWCSLGLFAVFVLLFFVTPEPMSEKLPLIPGVLVGFSVLIGASVWIMRKPYRVHRSLLAKVLRERPHDVVSVHEIVIRPTPGGQGMAQIRLAFDGEREFAPRSRKIIAVLGFMKVVERSQVFVKIRGKWVARKLVVTSDNAPELLSWLFATLAAANPACRWGDAPIAAHIGG